MFGTIVIKLIAIVYVSIIYIFIGLIISRFIDYIMPDIKPDPETGLEPHQRAIPLILLNLILMVILTYVIRNIIERIPFPLNGIYGYDHRRLRERTNMVIAAFIIMYYQTKLRIRCNMVLLNSPRQTL